MYIVDIIVIQNQNIHVISGRFGQEAVRMAHEDLACSGDA